MNDKNGWWLVTNISDSCTSEIAGWMNHVRTPFHIQCREYQRTANLAPTEKDLSSVEPYPFRKGFLIKSCHALETTTTTKTHTSNSLKNNLVSSSSTYLVSQSESTQ